MTSRVVLARAKVVLGMACVMRKSSFASVIRDGLAKVDLLKYFPRYCHLVSGCDIPDCPGTPDCAGQGICDGSKLLGFSIDIVPESSLGFDPPQCTNCSKGWMGPGCSLPCVHGNQVPMDSGICVCDPCFTGLYHDSL